MDVLSFIASFRGSFIGVLQVCKLPKLGR